MNSPISLGSGDIELVEEFCYLGSVISTDCGTDKDIGIRTGKNTGMHLGPDNQCGSCPLGYGHLVLAVGTNGTVLSSLFSHTIIFAFPM